MKQGELGSLSTPRTLSGREQESETRPDQNRCLDELLMKNGLQCDSPSISISPTKENLTLMKTMRIDQQQPVEDTSGKAARQLWQLRDDN